ncbi:hypothetical protein M0R04_08005 [Candidatus Dojkabacteria bacterium]|nr:hypothetical protein [Candidatus Dojkabacteria bacterium]
MKYNSKVTYKDGKVEKSDPIVVNQPTFHYVDVFSLLFNPFAPDFYTTPKFYRDIAHMSDLKKRYGDMISYLDKAARKQLHDKAQRFSDLDFKKIKNLRGYEWTIKGKLTYEQTLNMSQSNHQVSFADDGLFSVDWTADLMEYVECWLGEEF